MTRKRHLTTLIAAAMTFCAALVHGATNATAAEIKILASANAALRGALTELAPQLEQITGQKVSMDFASANPLKRRIEAGESFDLVIAPGLVEELVKQGKVAVDTRTAFARTGLGIGVAKGAPKPDISSVDAFKRTLLNTKSIGNNPESEPGNQFLAVLDRLAIAQDVRPRLKSILTSVEMGTALQRREVDIVVSSITNLLEMPTIDVVAFPSEIQQYLNMVAGISATTKEPQAAKAVLQFLLSPTATAVLKAKGFEPNTAADNNDKLYGVWKLVSYDLEDAATKERKPLFGQHPKGYLILLPSGRMLSIITAESRQAPQTDTERSDAFRSLLAYSGRFRVDGNKFVTKVDVAWNEAWVGTDQERTYKLEGDMLHIISMTQPNVNFGGRMMTGILTWERER